MRCIMESLIRQINEVIYTAENRIFIAISGHGASGKTSFAKKLCDSLDADYNFLNTDTYIIEGHHLGNTYAEYRVDGAVSTFKITACMPIRHELNSLSRDIKVLKNGGTITTIDKPWDAEKVLYGSRKVTIIEGMSAAFLEDFNFDLSVYFYTDSETELERRKKRDVEQRGRNLDALIKAQEHRRDQYDLFMHPLSEKFDIIVDYSNNEFNIIKSNL